MSDEEDDRCDQGDDRQQARHNDSIISSDNFASGEEYNNLQRFAHNMSDDEDDDLDGNHDRDVDEEDEDEEDDEGLETQDSV